MRRTAVIFSPIYYQHNPGRGHPESAKRLQRIISELQESRLRGVKNWQFVEPEKARLNDVKLIHGVEYIEFVKNACKAGRNVLDVEGDTMVSSKSYEVALHAVGGTLKAVNLVMQKKFQNAFALVRPPGHHAEKYQAKGFCIFNNVAIAAQYLLKKFKLNRILILDIDAHHGNGTQEIFYRTDRVLYISLHENPMGFPGTGFTDEIGEGKGLGYNVNIPLPFKTNDYVYLNAINEVVTPIIGQFEPEFVLVSAGLDGHYIDPVGSLSLSSFCYQEVYETIVNLASKFCEGKLVSVLEGGYSLNFVGKIATTILAKISGGLYDVEDKTVITRQHIQERGERIIEEVKRIQKAFWEI